VDRGRLSTSGALSGAEVNQTCTCPWAVPALVDKTDPPINPQVGWLCADGDNIAQSGGTGCPTAGSRGQGRVSAGRSILLRLGFELRASHLQSRHFTT
jgi:hypothetical protein